MKVTFLWSHAWEMLIEPMYISIISIATIEEIFSRIDYLLLQLFIYESQKSALKHEGSYHLFIIGYFVLILIS